MVTGVQELKLGARMLEWSSRIAECRSSSISVQAWCKEQGIAIQTYYRWEKRFITEATLHHSLPIPMQAGILMRVNLDTLASRDKNTNSASITIRHEESVIALLSGSSAETASDLVKALNRQA